MIARPGKDATLTVIEDARAADPQPTRTAPPGGLVRADGGPLRLLVIDGDQLSGELISIAVRRQGWQVMTARNGESAVAAVRGEKPDLVVLDNALPDTDGLAVMRSIRHIERSIPIVILGSRTDDRDRIEALAQGGDDYIAKPFDVNEVVLRLAGLAKRARVGFPLGLRTVGDLAVNEFTHEVTRAGHPVSLTATEFKVLRLLIRNTGQIVSKAQILHEVWGDDSEVGMNVVEIFISYLRKKIDPDRPPLIHTVRGCGYMLKLR